MFKKLRDHLILSTPLLLVILGALSSLSSSCEELDNKVRKIFKLTRIFEMLGDYPYLRYNPPTRWKIMIEDTLYNTADRLSKLDINIIYMV